MIDMYGFIERIVNILLPFSALQDSSMLPRVKYSCSPIMMFLKYLTLLTENVRKKVIAHFSEIWQSCVTAGLTLVSAVFKYITFLTQDIIIYSCRCVCFLLRRTEIVI